MNKRRGLGWLLCPSHLLVALVTLAFSGWYAASSFQEHAVEQSIEHLTAQAQLVGAFVADRLGSDPDAVATGALLQGGVKPTSRIIVMLPSGKVLSDSLEGPTRIDTLASRPEVREAMSGTIGTARRYRSDLKAVMLHVAVPVMVNGDTVGIVRATRPFAGNALTLSAMGTDFLCQAGCVAILALIVSFVVARRVKEPVSQLKEAVARYASGTWSDRVHVTGSAEFQDLADVMNTMAELMRERFTGVVRQRDELEAVLSSMVEGVVVTDGSERILRVNDAAAKLFCLDTEKVIGKKVFEVVRNSQLQGFLGEIATGEGPAETEIILMGTPDTYLQAHGTKLEDSDGTSIGMLIVLNDVTRLKNLERVRKDFVTNVSHELKTPITSIKGFLETLREGAIDDPESAQRFLDIVIKQTDRLHSIVEDLLTLSRIERDEEKAAIRLQWGLLGPVLDAVEKEWSPRALERDITLHLHCDKAMAARINPTLLQQALGNLVDNAIKYSGPGSQIRMEAFRGPDSVRISVSDQGIGIPRDQIERIFERFYRVDKSRSREGGGTGLGLAIVRHIVNAHNGRVEVNSSVGQGTTFTLRLPAD